MTSPDFVKLALQMTTMLGLAILLGEVMRRARQPAVVGEMLGGILLGPTLFGWLAPAAYTRRASSTWRATLLSCAKTSAATTQSIKRSGGPFSLGSCL